MPVSSGVPGYLGRVLHPTSDEPAGTCFQLTPGVLATAWHVLNDLGAGAPGAGVRIDPLADGPAFDAVVKQVDPVHDLAVLRTDSPLPQCVTGVDRTDAAKHDHNTGVVVAGFGEVPSADGRTYRYMMAPGRWGHTTVRDDGVRLGRFSTQDVLRGMSGAPVRRSADDVVIGVVCARYNSDSGWLRDSVWVARTEDLALLVPRGLAWFSPHLRTHDEMLRSLQGKEQYLTSRQLEFVSPAPDRRSAPSNLLDTLTAQLQPGGYAGEQRGVLLVGVSGAGKTRTSFEVAARAQDRNWLVLHVVPGAGVTAPELVQSVMDHAQTAESERVLLVLDDVDSYPRLDLGKMGVELQTADPEGRVACLATARPGALRGDARDLASLLFASVELEDGQTHRAKVAAKIFRTVAPEARARWGEARLVAECSDRPVFALLIARALEEQARAGQRAPDLSELRRGELFRWLQRRLEKDFGDPTRADRDAGFTRPHAWLLASAVALLACPQASSAVESSTVELAVEKALDARRDMEFALKGYDVVRRLSRRGWLVASGDRLGVVHDIVADGLLDAALTPDRETVQSGTAYELLDALLDSGPAFPQAVRRLSRWTADQEDHQQVDIENVCARWLTKRAEAISALLVDDPDGGSGVAFDLLAGPPWQAGLLRLWDELVGPWLAQIELERPGELPEVLADAVRHVVGALPERLLSSAMAYLESRLDTRGTDSLLHALLRADGLASTRLDALVAHALTWLNGHQGERRAVYLLGTLLARQDLPSGTAQRVIGAARCWVSRTPGHPAASVVLGPLLDRDDLGTGEIDVLDAALTWLGRQNGNPNGSFVLRRILRRTDLDSRRDRAVGLALAWLRSHATRADASFVLRPLLLRADLTEEEARQAIGCARRWLTQHGGEEHRFVLGALLYRDESAIEHALELLADRPLTEPKQYLLRALLSRSDLPDPIVDHVVEAAVEWLRLYGHRPDSTLLHLLLRRRLGGFWTETAAIAVQWLERHGTGLDASFVLQDLLERDPWHPDGIRLALKWLALPNTDPRASYVLNPLLRNHQRLPEDQAVKAVAHGLRWLDDHAESPTARFVLEPLLTLRTLDPDQAAALLQAAATWLRDHALHDSANYVLGSLLDRTDLSPALRTGAGAKAADWLDRYPEAEGHAELLLTLCGNPGPDPKYAARVVPHALNWSATAGNTAVSGVLISLLHTVSNESDQRGPLIDHIVAWLAMRGTAGIDTGKVFSHLLAQRDLTDEQLARTAELLVAWLEPRLINSTVGRPLAKLLHNPGRGLWRATASEFALIWLSHHGARPAAGEVLLALLRDPDLPAECGTDVRRLAEAWIEVTEPSHWSWSDLAKLLGRKPPCEGSA